MSRGTGVFHPRSQEERHSSTSADSSTATTSNTHQRRSRGSRPSARAAAATGDARPSCASHQATDTPAQRIGPGQHGVTLRRVPWQQQRTQDTPSRFAVGSCPDRLLMCQPRPTPRPPPPPAAPRAAAGSAPQPAQTDSSDTRQVLQQQAAGGSASTLAANSMLAPAACIPGPSSDSIGSAPHTPWSSNSSSSSSALWPPSPAPAAAAAAAAAGDSDQLLLPPRPQLSGALPQPATDAFPWPLAAQQRLQGTTLVGGSNSSSSFHSLPLTGALQSPTSQPVAAVSSSLSASLPSGGIWGNCREDVLPPGALFGAVTGLQDRQSSMCVADNLSLFGSSAPGSWVMKPMPPPCQDQQQLLSGSSSTSSLPWLAEPSWSGGQPCSPAGAAAAATDATLAALTSQLAAATGHAGSCADAAVHVAAAPAAARTHSGMSGLLPACGLGTSLDSIVLGSSLDSYSTGLLSGCHGHAAQSSSGLLAPQQQLQLANNSSSALSFSSIRHNNSTSSMHTAHMSCSVPLSTHGHSLQGVPMLPSAAVQLGPGCQMGGVAGMPLSNGAAAAAAGAADSNAMAAAVAQLKLQQLLAVEQIQQQLQEEVLRLLPLI